MRKKDKLFSLSVLVSMVILALIYFLNPSTKIVVNRTMEMLFTSDSKGMVMYYYEFTDFNYVFSILVSALQMLIPPLAKLTVINANIKFFGGSIALLVSLIGMIVGLSYAYAIGRALSAVTFGKFINRETISKYSLPVILVISIVWSWPFIFIGYICGLLLIDFKKFFSAITLGKLISLCYLIFIR